MQEVTKEQIWNFVKDKDVIYAAEGNWPYTGIWKTRAGNIVAKDVPFGRHLGISSDKYNYYINKEE